MVQQLDSDPVKSEILLIGIISLLKMEQVMEQVQYYVNGVQLTLSTNTWGNVGYFVNATNVLNIGGGSIMEHI